MKNFRWFNSNLNAMTSRLEIFFRQQKYVEFAYCFMVKTKYRVNCVCTYKTTRAVGSRKPQMAYL